MGSGRDRRLLLVEDDPTLRTTLSAFLAEQGFSVTTAASAEEGLAKLKSESFELVLSDYVLPGETGTWMLKQAQAFGVLKSVGVVLYTGHPGPEGADAFRVIGRPADLEHLLHTLEDAAAGAQSGAALSKPVARLTKPPARMELVLYVSSQSSASSRAVRNLEALLTEFDAAEIDFAVCDLATDLSDSADEDRIAFTPTLVKRSPAPREWFLGDLANISPIRDVLLDARIAKAR